MVSLMKGITGNNNNHNKKTSRKQSLQVSRTSKVITKSDHHKDDGSTDRNSSRNKKVLCMPPEYMSPSSITSLNTSSSSSSSLFSKLTSTSATSLSSCIASSVATSFSSSAISSRSISDLQRSINDLHHQQRSLSHLPPLTGPGQDLHPPGGPLDHHLSSPPSHSSSHSIGGLSPTSPLSKYSTSSAPGLIVSSCFASPSCVSISTSLSSGVSSLSTSRAGQLVSDLLRSKCDDLVEVNLSVRSSDLSSCDEMKIWKEEGEEESEMNCSEQLQAELQEDPGIPLIPPDPPDLEPPTSPMYLPGKLDPDGPPFTPPGYLGPLYSSYPPPHLSRSGSPTFFYQEHLGSPPPAHMGGIPYSLEPHKGLRGYPFTSQYNPYLSPDLTSCAISRFSSGLFGGSGFSSPPLSPPKGLPLLNQVKLEPGLQHGSKKPHIKKPLNAFMLYMKEMRPKVVAECTLKESAAINQILGRKWHALSREEQAKYYEQARKERQIHMQLYPGWSARDNYAQSKKKKRKREKNGDMQGSPLKKCRGGRQGFDQQDLWYRPCKPEEAIDGAGDTVPLFSQPGPPPPGAQVGGGSSLDPGGPSPSPLSLVTACSEPLLDLRSFSHHMNSSLLTAAAASSSSMSTSGSLGSAANILSASLGPLQPPPGMSPTGNLGGNGGPHSSIGGIPSGLLVGGSLDPAAGCHASPDLSYGSTGGPTGPGDPINQSPKYICL